MKQNFTKVKISLCLWLAFGQSLIAVAGSLAFSYVWRLPACTLCLYQRLLMFFLLVLISGSIIRPRGRIFWFAFPLALIGTIIAAYQNLLQLGWFSEPDGLCGLNTISCATKQLAGPFSIPLLSLLAFVIILGCLFFDREEKLLPDKVEEER